MAVSTALVVAAASAPPQPDLVAGPESPQRTQEGPEHETVAADRASAPVRWDPAAGAASAADTLLTPHSSVWYGGIPATVLDAYQRARRRLDSDQPACQLSTALLAAIGKVESGHARGGLVDATGTTAEPILGPVLDGGVFAAIPDTDRGLWDGDLVWDRAVGPMQFIPSTWTRWASDGNDDGRANPHNVYDASLAAARYLCAADRDLSTSTDVDAAILSYNRSASYLTMVRFWLSVYSNGLFALPDVDADSPAAQAAPERTRAGHGPVSERSPGKPPTASPAPPTRDPDPPRNGTEPSRPSQPSEPDPILQPPITETVCAASTVVETGVGLVGGLLGGLLGQQTAESSESDCADNPDGSSNDE